MANTKKITEIEVKDTKTNQTLLADLESKVTSGYEQAYEALKQIRDDQLYKLKGYNPDSELKKGPFERYCEGV